MDSTLLAVGAAVWAVDKKNKAGEATVVAERGEGDEREVRVHWFGFNKKLDEWISVTSEKLSESRKNKDATAEWGGTAGHVEGDKWVVEKVLDKRPRQGITEYEVKWEGWPDADITGEARWTTNEDVAWWAEWLKSTGEAP